MAISLSAALIPLLILAPVGASAKSDSNSDKVVAASPPASHAQIGPWTLTVTRDAFVGHATCVIEHGRQFYEGKTLVLRLSPKEDTTGAIYRIDWGAPIPVVADRATIARLGFAVWRDGWPNPSGGLVRIPYAKLAGAHAVQVEARPGAQIWSFSLEGLPAAVAAANAAGCI